MTKRIVPWIVFAVFLGSVGASALRQPASPGGFDLVGFRRLPVSVNGRVQPLDSVARIALRQIRGTATLPFAGDSSRHTGAEAMDATEWLLEVLVKPDAADTRKIFPVADRDLAAKLSLQSVGAGTTYYAFRDLAGRVDEIATQTQRVAKVKVENRAAWERELLQLQARLIAYERLKNSVQPNSWLQREAKGGRVTFAFADALAAFRSDLTEAFKVAARRRRDASVVLDRQTEQRLRGFARLFQPVSKVALLAVIPPRRPADPHGRWTTMGDAIMSGARGERLASPVAYLAQMSTAFATGEADKFNDAVAAYRRWLESNGLTQEVVQSSSEVFYNALQPFVRAGVMYAAGLALLCVAWGARSRTVYRAAVLLVVLGLALQTIGLAFAFRLAGRPSLFALGGWLVLLAGFAVEWFWRRGVAVAVAATAAAIALAPAYRRAPGGAAALLGNAIDGNFLLAVLVTAVALAIFVVVSTRRAKPRAAAPMPRPAYGYAVSRRSLGTE